MYQIRETYFLYLALNLVSFLYARPNVYRMSFVPSKS